MRPRVFFLRRDRHGVSPVFAEILMVLMTLVMAITVFLMVSNPFQQASTPATNLIFKDSRQFHANAPGYCCLNDTILELASVTGASRGWESSLEFQIKDAFGAQMLLQGELTPAASDPADYYLGVYHGAPDQPSIINVGYADVDRDSFISAPDHIEVRGMSQEYHGAVFTLVADGLPMATAKLP